MGAYCCKSNDFNPRSREGSDGDPDDGDDNKDKFQSTLPRRERRSGSVPVWDSSDFNPRSREGSDAGY